MPRKRHWLSAKAVLLIAVWTYSSAIASTQDVQEHLATKTRYSKRLLIPGAPSVHALPDPPGYNATTLWLLSRHGTRWPTEQRIKQIEALLTTFQDATNTEAYPWIQGWVPPTLGVLPAAGDLHPIGEEELWSLGVRLRQRFPHVLRSAYLPRRHPILSTQVPRASASAFAFAAGFFPPHPPPAAGGSRAGSDGPDEVAREERLSAGAAAAHRLVPLSPSQAGGSRPQAVAIAMSPKEQDTLLRFYDTCPAYQQRKTSLRPWLTSWLVELWAALAPAVARRLGITARALGACEVDALWTLCQYEAGLLGETGQACQVFSPEERAVLEWLDDVDLLEAQGWGAGVNYRIAAPLLQDLRHTLQAAAHRPADSVSAAANRVGADDDGGGNSGGAPHTRLLFAHCETLVPLATLLGLFEPELLAPPGALAPGPRSPSSHKGRATAEANREFPQLLMGGLDASDVMMAGGLAQAWLAGLAGGGLHDGGRHKTLNEGVDACVSGAPPPTGVPPPAGWYPRTPLDEARTFRGGRVSPYGANLAVVLYSQPPGVRGAGPAHLVRLVYNEQVLPIPGCTSADGKQGLSGGLQQGQGALDCDLEAFLAATEQAAADSSEERFGQLCAAQATRSAAGSSE